MQKPTKAFVQILDLEFDPFIRYVQTISLNVISLSKVDFTVVFFGALPSLFALPKQLGNASEALLHVLKVRTVVDTLPATNVYSTILCIFILNKLLKS